ncbi:diacylglycerol/lipid kinase family protein [Tenacibaculum amylolyticum]|uniref:diacylglycerol/lipid kinase family protein n=1 Tax=Tenacibaculum amylolyticum TaxID=104269 RepID=UPI00389668B8
MIESWFVIANPTAGNGSFNKLWSKIKKELTTQNISYTYALTTHQKHEIVLVHDAIAKGYTQFISVGGDGTLHHIVNGIMTQKHIPTNKITVAVIPLGTGNDWIKTYNITKNITSNITLIKQQKTIYQDIGYLELENTSAYFNNVAGIGYDGYVVNKLNKLKRFGPMAYLLSGISGLLLYKKTTFDIVINNELTTTKCLMTLFGICKYSGGGMQLTDYKDSTNGLFDITIAKNLSFKDLILNLKSLYSGSIIHHKKVSTYLTDNITVTPKSKEELVYIQADGELIGTGYVKASIQPKAIKFIVNN